MQNNRTEKLFSWRLLLPAGVVLFCVLTAYAFKGIFPFGTESVVHDDMGQCSVPIFYSIWDALHGDGSILYNLRTAGGVFISGQFEGGMSLFNILFLLICPRDRILDSMSFFLLFKMMIASVTAMLFFQSRFRMSVMWQTVCSVLYAFNPFLLQYYSNASWLECVMLLPLIFLGADRLLTRGKPALYILALTYSLILQLYISYMIVLFLFLDGALYIWFLLPKENRKSAAVRFGISTVLSLALSAFSALPSYFYMTSTSRYENTRSYFAILLSTAGHSYSKFGMVLFLTALPIAIAVSLLFQIRKKTGVVLYFGISLALFAIPVVFENVNLLWHMGSYVHFSMRYAFLFHLMLLCAAGYVLSEIPQTLFLGTRVSRIAAVSGAVCAAAAAVYFMTQKLYVVDEKGLIFKKNFTTVLIVFALTCLVYFLLVKFGARRVSSVLLCVFVLFECTFYGARAFTTGSPRNYEYSLDFIDECNVIHETLPDGYDGVSRIKNIDASLNTNYPLIVGAPSMSNFTHTIPASIKQTMLRLGYSAVYTRILDTGGTLFTDALLGYRYVLSLNKLSEDDYTFLGTSGRYMVYESRYAFPFGTVCSSDILSDKTVSAYAFDTMNNIWRTMTGGNSDLLDRPEVTKKEYDKEAVYELDVDGTKELYLVVSGMSKRKSVRITVNGKLVSVPNLGEPDNTLYTTRFNNSILDVGCFSDAHVTVRVQVLNPAVKVQTIRLRAAALDKSMLYDYSQSVQNDVHVSTRGITYSIGAEADTDGKFLFLPITYDASMRCRVNGKTQKAVRALDNFTAVELQKGSNDVQLTLIPKGFIVGLCVSILSVFAAVFWFLRQNEVVRKLSGGKLGSVVLVGYYAADCAAFSALYVAPMIGKFYTHFFGG